MKFHFLSSIIIIIPLNGKAFLRSIYGRFVVELRRGSKKNDFKCKFLFHSVKE